MANGSAADVLSTQGARKPPVKNTKVMSVRMLIKRKVREPLQVVVKQCPATEFWHVDLLQDVYKGSFSSFWYCRTISSHIIKLLKLQSY